jgi:hypothetical protein
VEAFEEVLDLCIPKRLRRLVDVHNHGPLDVGDGAGYCVQTLERLTSPAVAEAQPQCRAWSILGAARGVRSEILGRPEKAATIGPLQCSTRLTQWRRGALLS